MLYAFGDSFTNGHNFSDDDKKKYTWPVLLSKKLNCDHLNFAEPGSSNWQTTRKLQSLNIKKDDFVIISWSMPYRFEMCFEKIMPPLVEHGKTENIKKFSKIVYEEMFDSNWFDEMFKVMYRSCLDILKESNCKWLMFNAWTIQFGENQKEEWIKTFDIPQYVLGPKKTMCGEIRNGFFEKYFKFGSAPSYWNEKEHEKICDILHEELMKNYG